MLRPECTGQRRLLRGVYTTNDCSHGVLVWHTSATLEKPMSCGSETSYVRFSVEQNGEALRLVQHSDDRSLLSLPWPPKNRIFSSILYPDRLQIDLRNPTTVPFSLTYVNRATMHKQRDLLLVRNNFILPASNTRTRSTFSHSDRLRRLMCTTFLPNSQVETCSVRRTFFTGPSTRDQKQALPVLVGNR